MNIYCLETLKDCFYIYFFIIIKKLFDFWLKADFLLNSLLCSTSGFFFGRTWYTYLNQNYLFSLVFEVILVHDYSTKHALRTLSKQYRYIIDTDIKDGAIGLTSKLMLDST